MLRPLRDGPNSLTFVPSRQQTVANKQSPTNPTLRAGRRDHPLQLRVRAHGRQLSVSPAQRDSAAAKRRRGRLRGPAAVSLRPPPSQQSQPTGQGRRPCSIARNRTVVAWYIDHAGQKQPIGQLCMVQQVSDSMSVEIHPVWQPRIPSPGHSMRGEQQTLPLNCIIQLCGLTSGRAYMLLPFMYSQCEAAVAWRNVHGAIAANGCHY